MKAAGLYLLNFILLTVLISCGKDNKSGKPDYTYGINGYGAYNSVNSPYAFNGTSANAIFQYHPCTTGMNQQARTTIQFPLTGFPSYVAPNEVYAGVTTHGDVALVIGQGSNPPMFVAYVCQRSQFTNGQGQLVDLALGTYTKCPFKQLTRATMIIPGAYEPLYFRMLEGGSSSGQRFPFCSL